MEHFEYNQIDDCIFIGTTVCCPEHWDKLLRLGIAVDVDLQEEKLDHPTGVTAFLWLPTSDFTPPSLAQLEMGAHFIRRAVKHGVKCYIHCNAGEGRAPTLAAAYYILTGLTPAQAIQKIQQRRPKAQPNQLQLAALAEYYRVVHGER